VISWSGYTKQYIRYAVTWTVDLAFVTAFIGHIVLIEVTVQNNPKCVDTSITTPTFCPILNIVWVLSIAVCGLFGASGFCVGWVHLNEKRPKKTISEGSAIDRGIALSAYTPSQTNMRNASPMAIVQAPQHHRAVAVEGEGYGYSGAPVRPARNGDVRSVRTIPSRAYHDRTGPEFVEDLPWHIRSAHSEMSNQTAATAPTRPSRRRYGNNGLGSVSNEPYLTDPPRRRHGNSSLASALSEPYLRGRPHAYDPQSRAWGTSRQGSMVAPANGVARQDEVTKGRQAAADILSGRGRGDRRTRPNLDAVISPTPVRSFSPVSWTGNTEYSEGEESRRGSGVAGEIPIRLSISPAASPPRSPTSPYTPRMGDRETGERDPRPYLFPNTAYVTPEELLKRYSASVYETEYASTSEGDSIPKTEAKQQRNPRSTPRPSRPVKPKNDPPDPQRPARTPRSPNAPAGPSSRANSDSLAQNPSGGSGDGGGQTRQVPDKAKKSWWNLGLRATTPA